MSEDILNGPITAVVVKTNFTGQPSVDLKDYISIRNLTSVNYKPVGSFYTNVMMGNREVEPEFDLKKVFMFYHNEPLVERSIKKRVDMMFKNGFKIVGPKQKVVNYVNRRLFEICLVSETTLKAFLLELAENLFKYSNVFILRRRDKTNTTGSITKYSPKDPVATYQIISPLVMKPYINKAGAVVKWRRYDLSGHQLQEEYDISEVIHMYVNKETGFIFGKPLILSVIPDVEALRRIEENVQMLIAQHLFPLYQYQVGTDERPATYYPDGSSEVEVVQKTVVSLPTQGVVFTPERHKITAVSNSNMVDVTEYLEYFKTRVLVGLGVSSVDLGISDTSNRGTATTVSQNLKDSVTADQEVFSNIFNNKIIADILRECTFTVDIIGAMQEIELRFSTIDIDEKIKKETHAMALYVGGMLTHTEARDALSLESVTEDQLLDETQVGFKFKLQAMLKAIAPPTKMVGSGESAQVVPSDDPGPVVTKALNILRPGNALGSGIGPTKFTNMSEDKLKELTDKLEELFQTYDGLI